MSFAELSAAGQIESLSNSVASILSEYGIEATEVTNINHEYNSTFAITAKDGERFALRININSGRVESNVMAELHFISALSETGLFSVAKPIRNSSGNLVTNISHQESGRSLLCVLFTWLDGDDLGDDPSVNEVFEVGKLMAQLHQATTGLIFPSGMELPHLDDFMWQVEDLLLGANSQLSDGERSMVSAGRKAIEEVLSDLFADSPKQPIHADLHGWNLKRTLNGLSVFDFDDSGMGIPIQDLATTSYYMDSEDQVAALKAGYSTIRPLPKHDDYQMRALLLQRRLHLLNYIYETQNPEHRELLPKYKVETFRRIDEFLKLSP